MKIRYILSAMTVAIAAHAAQAQVYPAAYNEPYCREFTKVVNIGGHMENAYGQACQQPDGSWQIVSDQIPQQQPVQYAPQYNQVEYLPPQPAYYPQPVSYYREPSPIFSSFSLSFSNWGGGGRDHWRNRDWGHGNNGHSNNHGGGHQGGGRGHH
jgi:hypothetical protein